jgi:hypothetical protein
VSLLLLLNNQVAPVAGQTFPTVQVLLETTTDVMVDISADYKTFSTTRGRNRELDRFQAGTAQVTLLDTARKYDPSNTAGPYYPNLKPMRALQLTGTWDGTTYPIFTGTVDSFESEYDGPPNGYAQTTIYATDGFKVLAAAEMASSAYVQEVIAASPAAWYRLDEPAGSTTFFDQAGTANLTVNGTPTFGAESLISREAGTAVTFPGPGTTDGGARVGALTVAAAPFTFEMVFRDIAGGLGASMYGEVNGALPLQGWAVLCTGTTVTFQVVTAAGSQTVATTGSVADGQTHHLAFTWAADGTMTAYFDGVAQATAVLAAGALPATGYAVLGAGNAGVSNAEKCKLGTYDEVAIYTTALDAATIAAHAEAVATPWNNDTPGGRIGRALDAGGWPSAARDLDTGTSTLQSADLDGTTVLEHTQKAAESDFGALFMTADGKVRFIGRQGLFNQPQLATFGDGGGAELAYRSLRPELTDQLIRNDVTVSRVDGTAQNARDATSITTYLRHSYVADGLYHDSDEVSRSAAEFLVSEYKDPRRRISNMVVTPLSAPSTLFPQALGRDLQDQITVLDRPPGGGAANTQDTAIEGISHTVTPMWWETSWNLAPSFGTGGTPPNVWQLGVAGFSELGETTRLGL